MRIFVYGTLKRGFCRHHHLSNERFLGKARTAPAYRMFDLGSYPGLIEAGQGGISIHGEIYDVSSDGLRQLDLVEAVNEGEYERRPIELEDPDSELTEAYFYLPSVDRYSDCGPIWNRETLE